MDTLADERDGRYRFGFSLLIGLVAGLVVYLAARAGTTVYLFYQQQQLLQNALDVMRGDVSVEALAALDIRETRLLIASLEEQYQRLSVQIGFAAAAIASVLSYIWMERAAAAGQPFGEERPASEPHQNG